MVPPVGLRHCQITAEWTPSPWATGGPGRGANNRRTANLVCRPAQDILAIRQRQAGYMTAPKRFADGQIPLHRGRRPYMTPRVMVGPFVSAQEAVQFSTAIG